MRRSVNQVPPANLMPPANPRLRTTVPTIIAFVLVALGVWLAVRSERTLIDERAEQTTVQARIMAAALTGALAFDDAAATREYLGALKLNPAVRAAAVYTHGGAIVAGFTKDRVPFPTGVAPHAATVGTMTITVAERVHQGDLELGTVYVQSNIEPLWARLSRYAAIGVMIVFAAALIVMLGRSFARVAQANDQLRAEIVAREHAERALAQAQKMEALGHLTGGIAHDFNNLLMAASSGLELVERSTDPGRREKYVLGIREALDRGARLTRQLLTFARHSPVNAEVVDVRARLHGLAELLERSLRGDIALEWDLADGLWPIMVDPVQFEVAVVNIAVNARDAMPNGGVIRISAHNRPGTATTGDAVRIAIADQGCGIAPELQAKVFDPFFTTKAVGEGTGLGLSQVYGFVRAAGGDVEIDSAPNRGTTLSLMLPRSRDTALPRAEPGDAAPPHVRAQTVLVVEDDPRIAESLCEMLLLLGCSPICAADPAEGLHLIAARRIDVVLSDMVMPGGINGLDLARVLRDRADRVPVILMSGFSDLAERAREEGFAMLDKPFTLQTLAQAIATADATRSREA
jgi:signal transduction histidine kinase